MTDLRLTVPGYRADYARGYRATDLEAGDRRGESDAWYDGFLDAATGRERWHFATCQDRDRHEHCDGVVTTVTLRCDNDAGRLTP